MSSSHTDSRYDPSGDSNYVSGRFLTDFFSGLDRQGIGVAGLLGDLPIPVVGLEVAAARVEWPDFVELLKRLEYAVGGPIGLESCGAELDRMKYAGALRGLAGLTASPHSLYRAATRWALKRAMPGIETRVVSLDANRIEIHAKLSGGMRPCPQVFHIAAGTARALPRILGLRDAVVDATIEPAAASYRLTLPPSPTLVARVRRFARAIYSAGSVVHVLEAQQLELHSEHDALRKAHADLAESEERYRAFTDATVDVLCELDTTGHVAFVSASIEELLGYTPDQVTGSHFRLWLPNEFHDVADSVFQALCQQAADRRHVAAGTFARKLVALHAANGRRVIAELSLRCFENALGEQRFACVLRDLSDTSANAARHAPERHVERRSTESNPPLSFDRVRRSLGEHRPQRPNGARSASMASDEHRGAVLEHSLEILLAALDKHTQDSSAQDASVLTRASEAMTRVVESALLATDGDSTPAPWIETRKLLEEVRLEAMAGSERGSLAIRYPAGSIPAEIRAHGDLLVTGLSNLVESARPAERGDSRIELWVVAESDPDGTSTIEFRVESRDGIGENPASQRVALSDAIASDVARAHGGELVVERHEGGGAIRRLVIPNLD